MGVGRPAQTKDVPETVTWALDQVLIKIGGWEERREFAAVNAHTALRLAAPTLTGFARSNPVS